MNNIGTLMSILFYLLVQPLAWLFVAALIVQIVLFVFAIRRPDRVKWPLLVGIELLSLVVAAIVFALNQYNMAECLISFGGIIGFGLLLFITLLCWVTEVSRRRK